MNEIDFIKILQSLCYDIQEMRENEETDLCFILYLINIKIKMLKKSRNYILSQGV